MPDTRFVNLPLMHVMDVFFSMESRADWLGDGVGESPTVLEELDAKEGLAEGVAVTSEVGVGEGNGGSWKSFTLMIGEEKVKLYAPRYNHPSRSLIN